MALANKKNFFKLVITIAIVAIILPWIEWGQFYALMLSINPLLLLLFLGIGLIDRWLMAFKWNLLLKIKGIHISNLTSLKLYVMGGFFNEFFPSGLGTDLYRIQSLTKLGNRLADTASSVLVERVFGFFATAQLAFVAMAVVAIWFDPSLIPYVYVLFFICFLPFALLMTLMYTPAWRHVSKMLGKFQDYALFKKLQSLSQATLEFKNNPSTLKRFFCLSLVEKAYAAVIVYIGAGILGLELKFIYCIAFVPATFILTKIPISIQGIGIQEGLFMFFFSHAGIQPTDAFSLSLLMRIGEWTWALSGACLLLANNKLTPIKSKVV